MACLEICSTLRKVAFKNLQVNFEALQFLAISEIERDLTTLLSLRSDQISSATRSRSLSFIVLESSPLFQAQQISLETIRDTEQRFLLEQPLLVVIQNPNDDRPVVTAFEAMCKDPKNALSFYSKTAHMNSKLLSILTQ